MTLPVGIALIALCILSQAFFSGTEIAMVQASRLALERRANEGHAGARRALALLREESTLLGTCLIGTNLASVIGATVVTSLLITHGIEQAWAPTAAYLPLTLIFGEALPKTVTHYHADRLAPILATPLSLVQKIFVLPVALVRVWDLLLSRLVGGPSSRVLSRHELLRLIDTPDGGIDTIDPEERKIIASVLSLSSIRVDAAMTPLVQVIAVNENATVGMAARIAQQCQHSRLPIYRGRIDHIVGLVHQIDLLFADDDREPIIGRVRPVRFVPDSKKVDDLLHDMRRDRDHFAVVVDEYGGSVGIITLEDLLEEVVGDIEDEHDADGPQISELPDGRFAIPGATPLYDVIAQTHLALPASDHETIAGLVLEAAGRIPQRGEIIEVGTFMFEVLDATERAILALAVAPPHEPPSVDENTTFEP